MSSSRISTKNKNNNDVRRRFTDEQIMFLEKMFEEQSRPELRTKHNLANKLGLHPRQIAIWFQNKRARSKSRQIEQDYNKLKVNYKILASKFESLEKENHDLINQLQMLRNRAEHHLNSRTERLDSTVSSSCNESEDKLTTSITKNNTKVVSENNSDEISVPFYDGSEYFGEDSKFVDIEEQLDSRNNWEKNRCSFSIESDLLQNWWEFQNEIFE